MVFITLQTIISNKGIPVPYLISSSDTENSQITHFTFRPELSLPAKVYEKQHLNRLEIINASPFCDIADHLIELFENKKLVFSEAKQFQMLKSLFRNIGYNFNVTPNYLFHGVKAGKQNALEEFLIQESKSSESITKDKVYASAYLELMSIYEENSRVQLNIRPNRSSIKCNFDLSSYKRSPGIYYFLNRSGDVIYVGKAKNVKKRLQSHFSMPSQASTINYAEVNSINVEYSGNDILAQLMESANIKVLQPLYNTQQINDPAPYIINRGVTAKGIHKLQITRKDVGDNMPEKYFNRSSVKKSLKDFCDNYKLCRKHCGLEKIKGPCSRVTKLHGSCVCSGEETIKNYNKRFDIAFFNFKNQKERKIFKLKGRNRDEDAFIYVVNGIYAGYGFIDKDVFITGVNDILGHLIKQHNNYDTARIISNLEKTVPPEAIMDLSDSNNN